MSNPIIYNSLVREDEENPRLIDSNIVLEKKLTISLAESCTGGMIAAALVDCPGVSDAFLEGCVCYSNAAKMR